MKSMKSMLMACLVFMVSALSANLMAQEMATEIKPLAEFDKTTFDFGKIEQGKPAKAVFKIKNSSMVPLAIIDVKASCGCTVADYPKEPIKPGETGEIYATYNAANIGPISKTVTVNTNSSEPRTVLSLKGEVVAKGSLPAEEK